MVPGERIELSWVSPHDFACPVTKRASFFSQAVAVVSNALFGAGSRVRPDEILINDGALL